MSSGHSPERDEPVSLAPLSPEDALRALLKVQPDDPPLADDGNGDDGGDEQARAK